MSRAFTLSALLSLGLTAAALYVTRPPPPPRPWQPVAPGVQAALLSITGGGGAQAVRIDLREASVWVVDARDESGAGRLVSTAMRERIPGAVAAVNGGFFDAEGQPMGLVIAEGRETNSLRRADWGVLWIAEASAGVLHTRQWRAKAPEGVVGALQAGPRLVVSRRPVGLKVQEARRTVACVRARHELILLVTEAIEANALATWLARPVAHGGLGCADALNLDGGPSSQLSLHSEGLSLEVEGGWPVPNGLVVVPKGPPPQEAPAAGPQPY